TNSGADGETFKNRECTRKARGPWRAEIAPPADLDIRIARTPCACPGLGGEKAPALGAIGQHAEHPDRAAKDLTGWNIEEERCRRLDGEMRAQARDVMATAIDQPRRVAAEERDAAIEPGRRQQRHADVAAADRPGRGRSLDRGYRRHTEKQTDCDEW